MNLVKKIIAILSFVAFVLIGIIIFFRQRNIREIAFEKSGIESIDNYYTELENKKRTSLGIYNIKNEDKILGATNSLIKEKIISLIKLYNSGDISDISDEYGNHLNELLETSRIKFIGDSNTEHFKFYDLIDKEHYFAMTGKNIDEQNEIISEEIFKDVDNVVFFNGYNLDKYDSADDYIKSYEKIIKKIKSFNKNINIYICSLLPATKKAIEEDIESPLPHKIYNGIKFDKNLENHNFKDAEYIDTKWFMEDDKHKSDGVHMERYFYEILVPYVSFYLNLNNDKLELDKSFLNDINSDTTSYYLEENSSNEKKIDSVADMLNSDEYVNEVINDELLINKDNLVAEDQYIFDVNNEVKFYTSICGIDTVLGVNDVVFVGDSHSDRLTRSLAGVVMLLARPSRTLRKLEDSYMNAFNMNRKYIVIYTSNNEVKYQTDLIEYRNEYDYIHKLVEQSDVVEDVFICTFFQNNVTKYIKNQEFNYCEKDYNDIIKDVCNEYDDMHYIDLSQIHKEKYILPDGHMGYTYNKKALIKIMRYIYQFDQLKKQKSKNNEDKDNSDKAIEGKHNLEKTSLSAITLLQDNQSGETISKNFKSINFASIDGKEIEWLVVDEDDESMTLLSKNILDVAPYNIGGGSTTWEKSSIRKYLNEEFYDKVFTSDEKEKVLDSFLDNNENPDTKTSGGEKTKDKVYLLSIDEVKKYFEDENGFAYKTLAAKVLDGLDIKLSKNKNSDEWYLGNSVFWLRSPGLYDDDASYINYNGSISMNGVSVDYSDMGIRPVIKIKK